MLTATDDLVLIDLLPMIHETRLQESNLPIWYCTACLCKHPIEVVYRVSEDRRVISGQVRCSCCGLSSMGFNHALLSPGEIP